MLFFLGVLILVIWAISSRGNDRKQKAELSRRNQEWVDFIAGYARVVHSAKEKALVRRMLDDIATQQLGRPSVPVEPATPPDPLPQGVAVPEMPSMPLQAAAVAIKPKATVQLDNASLLLYFGAFLFVAAAGLFVAFGGANGVVRTCIVLLVSLALYGGGIWLHRNRPKLKQAGQAFAGIGIVLAPLVGSALYVYVFNRSQGMLVWFMTSLLCLVMYAHALLVFRTALIGYVLVFTLLSLFESGVGVVHAPLYYYGWCLAAVGIGLQLVSRLRGGMAIVQETSSRSAMVLLPVSIVVSAAMVPEQGATQLGVSLLLAAAFYGLEALGTKDSEQEASAVISQLAAVCGVAALVYGVSGRWYTTAVSLLTVNALQLAVMGFHKTGGKLWRNYASVLLAVSLASTLAAAPYHVLLLTDIAAALLIAAVIWMLQRREDAYGLAGLYWLALPYVAGQLTFGPLTAAGQTAAGFAAAVLLLAVYLAQSAQIRASLQWRTVAAGTYMIGMSAVLVTSLFAAPVVTLVAAVALAGTCMVLIKSDHNKDWADAAGVIMMVPLLHSWDSRGIFLLSTLVALSGLVVLSIRFRRENLRWASTLVWLLLPVSLGHAQVGGHWSPTVYAWAYLLAMVGLVISRAVARGVLYLSSTVPMSSYARNASLSYVFGYGASAVLACLISLASPDSRFHTTAILTITGITAYVLSRYIEKRSDILAFLPVIAQAVLLSAIHPAHHASAAVFYGLAGTVVAVLVYTLSLTL